MEVFFLHVLITLKYIKQDINDLVLAMSDPVLRFVSEGLFLLLTMELVFITLDI